MFSKKTWHFLSWQIFRYTYIEVEKYQGLLSQVGQSQDPGQRHSKRAINNIGSQENQALPDF